MIRNCCISDDELRTRLAIATATAMSAMLSLGTYGTVRISLRVSNTTYTSH